MRMLALLLAVSSFIPLLPAQPPLFSSLDSTPVFVVGTVEQIRDLGPVSIHESRFPWPGHRFEVRITVRRVFSRRDSPPFDPDTTATIYYNSPDKLEGGGGGGLPAPGVLEFATGKTILIPLIQTDGRWMVEWDGSRNPVVPAIVEDRFGGPSRMGRMFVFRELVQVLVYGDARQRNQVAAYLMRFQGAVPGELPRLMAGSLGTDDDLWLEVGCAFLGVPDGARSIAPGPRNNAELVYGEASPPFHDIRQLVTWVLWKGDRRDYPNRLIRCLIRNAAAYDWGAAMTLADFRDSTTLIDELNRAMQRNGNGTITIARTVVNGGQRAVLAEALQLAERLLNRNDLQRTELWSATELLMRYGDDRQFETVALALARSQNENQKAYGELWAAAVQLPGAPGARLLRLAGVSIGDKRPKFGTLRYCDAATALVQRIAGVSFGFSAEAPVTERDAAVRRAAEWLHSYNRVR